MGTYSRYPVNHIRTKRSRRSVSPHIQISDKTVLSDSYSVLISYALLFKQFQLWIFLMLGHNGSSCATFSSAKVACSSPTQARLENKNSDKQKSTPKIHLSELLQSTILLRYCSELRLPLCRPHQFSFTVFLLYSYWFSSRHTHRKLRRK